MIWKNCVLESNSEKLVQSGWESVKSRLWICMREKHNFCTIVNTHSPQCYGQSSNHCFTNTRFLGFATSVTLQSHYGNELKRLKNVAGGNETCLWLLHCSVMLQYCSITDLHSVVNQIVAANYVELNRYPPLTLICNLIPCTVVIQHLVCGYRCTSAHAYANDNSVWMSDHWQFFMFWHWCGSFW